MRKVDSNILVIATIFILLIIGSLFFPKWLLATITVVIAKGLVALGVVLLVRCGLVSFGQGLYYCLGGYAVGLCSQFLHITDIFLLLIIAIVAGVLFGAVIGQLICRYREIFFAMFSLALAMILYGVLSQSQSLGSTDGFNISRPTALGMELSSEQAHFLIYIIACSLASVLAVVIHFYFKSDVGFSSLAAKENEIRMEYLGTSPVHIFYGNYILASILGAAGGAITALSYGHVGPDMSYWTQSGEFLFIAIIGGSANVLAAFLGAALFESVRTYALELVPDAWQLILGSVLVLIVCFLPNGLWSLLQSISGNKKKNSIEILEEPK